MLIDFKDENWEEIKKIKGKISKRVAGVFKPLQKMEKEG